MNRTTWIGTCFIILSFFIVGMILGQLHRQNQSIVQAQSTVGLKTLPASMGTPVPIEVPPLPEQQPRATPVVVQQAPVNPDPDPPSEQQLQEGLKANNWAFTPADPAHIAGTLLTQDQTLANTQKQFPELQQEASQATVHLGQLQNMGLPKSRTAGETIESPFAQPHLVWLVTFSGIGGVSSGPPGHARKSSNELNVAVDARTGTYLMDFVWTR